jgi:hypothetical protein
MDHFVSLLAAIIATVFFFSVKGWQSLPDALPVGLLSFVGALMGTLARAPYQRRQILHKLGEVYVTSQDLWRDALSIGITGDLTDFELKIDHWWRSVRVHSPLLSDRGRKFMLHAFSEVTDIRNAARNLMGVEDSTERSRLNAEIDRLKVCLYDRRLHMTTDRRLLITSWPARLDWLRLRTIDRPTPWDSGLSR